MKDRRTFPDELATCCLATGCGLMIGLVGLVLATIAFLADGGYLG